jgi:hypothetical protein
MPIARRVNPSNFIIYNNLGVMSSASRSAGDSLANLFPTDAKYGVVSRSYSQLDSKHHINQ